MVQFECPVLEGIATLTVVTHESVTGSDPCRRPGPLAYVYTGRSMVHCENESECGIVNKETGKPNLERCPAHIAMRDKDSLESLRGRQIVD